MLNEFDMVTNESVSQNEKELLSRINRTLDEKCINKGQFADRLGWQPSKLSRVLNGRTGLSLSDSSDMAQALGYPLEAFLQQEFDLDYYDQTHMRDIKNLRKCIENTLYWGTDFKSAEDYVKNIFPRTIRCILGLHPNEFLVEGEMIQNEVYIVEAEAGEQNPMYLYKPQITIKYKGINSGNNDTLIMGYWFAEGSYLALSICYIQNKDFSIEYNNNVKKYYKSIISDNSTWNNEFDMQDSNFADELKKGEICSRVYDLEESKMDEATLEDDLKSIFDEYNKMLRKTASSMRGIFWEFYNKVAREKGPKVKIEADDIKKMIEPTTGTYIKNLSAETLAIQKANGKCELCGTDTTFVNKAGNQYFEVHHLIPLKYVSDNAKFNQVSNLVCLCPMCHRKLLYSENTEREKLIVNLYYQRKNELENDGINISLAKLLQIYHVE